MLKPILILLLCSGTLVLIQSVLPKASAMQTPSNVDEFMIEDLMSHKRYNYIVQKAKNDILLRNKKNNGARHVAEYYDLDTNPEYLSDFMIAYGNVLKNDITLLDDSVETRVRKRNDLAIKDPPCSCATKSDYKDFGENTYPRFVEIKNCSAVQQQSCPSPYICKESLYNIYILKENKPQRVSDIDLPNNLKRRWVFEKEPISVGCQCTRDYVL